MFRKLPLSRLRWRGYHGWSLTWLVSRISMYCRQCDFGLNFGTLLMTMADGSTCIAPVSSCSTYFRSTLRDFSSAIRIAEGMLLNKPLKLAGAARPKGSGVLCAGAHEPLFN